MRKISLTLLSLATAACAFASHPEIYSLKELEKEFQKANEKTLIVFDIDEVLITTEDHYIHPYADEAFFSLIHQEMKKASSEEEKNEITNTLSLSMLLPARFLIEEISPQLIRTLQERNLKVIALTACPTGKFGVVPQVEHWRINHLRSLDIHFSTSFPHIQRCTFEELATSAKRIPLFEEGFLFSTGCKKGDLLAAFFKQSNFYPAKVIFIDDRNENLDSVQETLESLKIEFKGYLYRGAEKFFKDLDENLLHHQFHHLMRTKEWLSDRKIQEQRQVH